MSPARTRKKHNEEQVLDLEGQEVVTTNLDKVFWPDLGLTKGDLIAYYRRMAPYLLPHLAGRPVSLRRFPNGIQGNSFFQKDFDHVPAWVRRIRIESEARDKRRRPGPVDYLLCEDEATLVYMANVGGIEIHPWNSRQGSLEHPDYLVFDLDPGQRSREDLILAAQAIHAALDEVQAASLVKTSGKRGLHIAVPLGAKYSYDEALDFTGRVSRLVNRRIPELTSMERSPKKRQGKIYLDYLQNRRGQTVVAPYSPRPLPGAPVSAPLRWEEVRPGLAPGEFNLNTIEERIRRLGDLWQKALGKGIDLKASLEMLEEIEAGEDG